MIIKNAYYPYQLPTKIVLELSDGSFRSADLTPFRVLTGADLSRLSVFTPAMGDEIPDHTLKFYGLTKSSDSRLKQLRVEAGLTQGKLAEAAQINLRQIQKIEAGEIRLENVTLANAARLAQGLGVTIEELLK